ncbi:hypothetical protein C8Q74DRAFT_1215088 [Fomes fomentarius]|nr:hypothetical protein C8Q74DRAFT_1215088 [Fomes fomentarius]
MFLKGDISRGGLFSKFQSIGAKATNDLIYHMFLVVSELLAAMVSPKLKDVLSTLRDQIEDLKTIIASFGSLKNLKFRDGVGRKIFEGGFCAFSVAWELYKAYHGSGGNNPEIWQPLECCAACANGETSYTEYSQMVVPVGFLYKVFMLMFDRTRGVEYDNTPRATGTVNG